jgi:hypothetical protein
MSETLYMEKILPTEEEHEGNKILRAEADFIPAGNELRALNALKEKRNYDTGKRFDGSIIISRKNRCYCIFGEIQSVFSPSDNFEEGSRTREEGYIEFSGFAKDEVESFLNYLKSNK